MSGGDGRGGDSGRRRGGLGALLLLASQRLAGLARAKTSPGGLRGGRGLPVAGGSASRHSDRSLDGRVADLGRGHENAPHQELQLQAGRGSPRHGAQGLVGQVGGARQPVGTPVLCLALHAFELVRGRVCEDVARAVPSDRDDEQVPEALQEVLDEATRVVPGLHHSLDDAERGRTVPAGQGIDGLVQQGRVGVSEQRDRRLVGDFAVNRTGHQLVQDR